MKKLLFVCLFVLAASALVYAFPSKENTQSVSEGFRVIEDHAGRRVVLPKDVKRIAVTGIYPLPSVLAVFFNSADKIVSMNTPSLSAARAGLLGELYPEILTVSDKAVGPGGAVINAEELSSLDPDVVFYSTTAEGESIVNAGLPAVAVSVNKWDYNVIETLRHWLELLGEIFPSDADKVRKFCEFSTEAYELVQSRVADIPESERARVFVLFQYASNDIKTSGARFFGDWWCRAVGAVNVAHEIDLENAVSVNLEQVYVWDPDVILITNFTPLQPFDFFGSSSAGATLGSETEKPVKMQDWSGIKAVREGRVYKMPLGMYRSYTPGVDAPVTLLYLAREIYPSLFSDIDVSLYAKRYYKEIFGIELSDSQVSRIFAPLSAAADGMK